MVGGRGADAQWRKDGEVYDPMKREWAPLGAELVHEHGSISVMAVAGGLLAVDVDSSELYDEGSGRWLTLPHAIAEPRAGAGLVSLPAAALTAAA